MKIIKYLFFALIFTVLFSGVVNAEQIKITKISENDLTYKFDILIDDVTNLDNINVVEGVIYYDADLINNIELTTSSNWEFLYKLENDKVKFITYVANDFAESNDSLFYLTITLKENVIKNDIQILINDLVTNNGERLFNFGKMSYKLQEKGNVTESIPPAIEQGKPNNNLGNIVIDKEPENNDVEEDREDCNCECLEVPEGELVNKLEDGSNDNNTFKVIIVFFFVISVFCNVILLMKMYLFNAKRNKAKGVK